MLADIVARGHEAKASRLARIPRENWVAGFPKPASGFVVAQNLDDKPSLPPKI